MNKNYDIINKINNDTKCAIYIKRKFLWKCFLFLDNFKYVKNCNKNNKFKNLI